MSGFHVSTGLTDNDLPEAAAVLADAFASYPVQMSFTPESVRRMCLVDDVVLDTCAAARTSDERLVGVGFGALRANSGRVAAMGVATDLHHRGVGRAVGTAIVRELHRAGARQVILEALTVNTSALKLYEQLGFVRQRRLVGFVRPPGGLPISRHSWDDAIARGHSSDSWQLAHVIRSVRSHADLTMVPAVVPERHPVAHLLKDAGFAEAPIDQFELSLRRDGAS